MANYKVVISDLRFPDNEIERRILEQTGGCQLTVANCATQEQMIAACRDADGILLNLAPLTRDVVLALDRCKVVSRYGVGYDNVDVHACKERGIAVTNVPDYCEEDVSDLALAHLLGCLRKTALKDRLIRQGEWNINSPNMRRLKGKTVTLIGFGKIARCLLRKLKGFELGQVLVYDPFVGKEQIERCGAVKVELDEALGGGDFISLHLPLTEATKQIIDARAFGLMKPETILINTARGALIDEDALIDALSNNRIAGAGLDTYQNEPLKQDSRLLRLENCLLTDHTGFNTVEAVEELRTKAAQNVLDILNGRGSQYLVY